MENLLEQCPSANGVWLTLATKKMPCLSICPVCGVAPYSIRLYHLTVLPRILLTMFPIFSLIFSYSRMKNPWILFLNFESSASRNAPITSRDMMPVSSVLKPRAKEIVNHGTLNLFTVWMHVLFPRYSRLSRENREE